MTGRPGADSEQEVIDEGCYFLSKLKLDDAAIAKRFEIAENEVAERRERHAKRIMKKEVHGDEFDLSFWRDVLREAEGNIKITFVSDKGFHHAWKSDLQRLDGPALLSIYESCKQFLDMDPNARFLEYDAPKNYDPLAMAREIKKAVGVIGALLQEKWEKEKGMRSNK